MSNSEDTLYGPVSNDILQRASQVKLLICDVDGVFSDGRIYLGNDGEELKAFHTRDGFGVKALMASGVEVAVITGRQSQIVQQRMENLGLSHIYQGQEDKLSAFEQLLAKTDTDRHECAYIGDDLVDWPVMACCGLSVCVADGHPLLRKRSDFITVTPGGFGAVRELCDLIMHSQGTLDDARGASI